MDSLVQQVLGNPSQYPLELTSWIAKKFSGNKLLQIDWPQLPGPKITSGAISAGPPKTPDDGDIWIALAAGANGENWQFRYNAGSASAYKWEFIGGSELSLLRSIGDAYTSNNVWKLDSNLGTLTAPRGGEYVIRAHAWITASVSGAQTINIGLWYNGAQDIGLAGAAASSASFQIDLGYEWIVGANAGDTVGLSLLSNSASAITVNARSFSIVPRRVA